MQIFRLQVLKNFDQRGAIIALCFDTQTRTLVAHTEGANVSNEEKLSYINLYHITQICLPTFGLHTHFRDYRFSIPYIVCILCQLFPGMILCGFAL